MADVVDIKGRGVITTPQKIIQEITERNPDILACVERSGGEWRFSFSAMNHIDKLTCLGALKRMEIALLSAK